MSGLALVPALPGWDADAAADALASVVRAGGGEAGIVTPVPDLGDASPYVAADHLGEAHDLDSLVAAAGGALGFALVVLPGGPLTPVTERSTVRDVARAIRLPVVVVTPAGAVGAEAARLAVSALRAGGLAVPAVVVSPWPEPPSRIELDECVALARGAGTMVVTLEPGFAGLDPDGWGAARAEGVSEGAAAAAPELEPYREWPPPGEWLADPRSAGRPALMAALAEIVAEEGPILASRALSLYNKASGGKKLTTAARTPLESAMHWLGREGKIVLVPESDQPWQGEPTLRTPDTPPVAVRALGPRPLHEVPLDEIAELMGRLRAAGVAGDEDALKRATLDAYGLVRMTAKADELLGLAFGLLGD